MQNFPRRVAPPLLALAGLCCGLSAQADATLPGSTLLTAAYKTQLETWLGEGRLGLNRVYAKAAGDTSLNFHQAADGKGRTFSVMQATNELGQTWLVGGYNPQSWSSINAFNMTPDNKDRTAFLFNLSSGALHRQTPKTPVFDTTGAYQTYNSANAGPTFGVGHDLFVPANLSTGGHSWSYSYIDPEHAEFGKSLLDGSTAHHFNISYGAIEVFTISVVPEPGRDGMLAAGLAGLAGLAWTARRRRVAPA
ncbi:PEP_CTERM-anchored TLD domain-containing protein [Janthinobacterium fluminis]|uniref:PEP_CTERM-anchored TLD domain-containing protein n=1 Tax=Janthinobacterium fluminis TaxID=2987524 RepID=A0ABT5JYN7_9BURK|nr:PEP_CTERM-anchored TLD domain-containing protein [Janthinobacterium fluminis]MDC8757596.1 PEP_CTERM-anchored TLD domain-containing protein [Janthinobacterium fluminis]